MVAQVTLRWSGVPNSPGGVWTMHAATIADAGALVGVVLPTFDTSFGGSFVDGLTLSFDGEIREYNTLTGTLTDVVAGTAASVDVGQATNDPVPNASQVLLRWNTSTIVAGKRLKGRTFMPGLDRSACVGGELLPATQASIGAALDTIVDSGYMVIWHRPVNNAGGAIGQVTGSSVWNELAVLRNRRA